MTSPILLAIEDLTVSFDGFKAVDGLNLYVERNEVRVVIGPNGAGKSTTMKMITGFLTPTKGTVRVCGYDVLNDPISVKAHLGYLPEGAPAYADMTPDSFLKHHLIF